MTGIKLYLFINKVIPQRAIKTLEKSFLKKNQETGQGEDKRNGLKTTDEQHLKVMSLRYREKNQQMREMHSALQLIHPQFTEASPDMVLMERWL